jgi:PadR family transcriptional regulator PadR
MSDAVAIAHTNWLSQVKRGTLELCILRLLDRESMYGYQIVKTITAIPGMGITEGTIYPLLSRLKTQGFLASSLIESPQGPARRTYVLTAEGRDYLALIHDAWHGVVRAVDACAKPVNGEAR